MAKQQRISSVLLQRRFRFLGHLFRMKDHRFPKKLLVSTLVGGQQVPQCWLVVIRDLRACALMENWRETSQDRAGSIYSAER
jgi:hypothetical protein